MRDDKEVHGPTYRIAAPNPSDDRHSGDPTPHGLPPAYSRPQSVQDLILANTVRALPVTQQVEHGPEQSRSAEFQEAALLGGFARAEVRNALAHNRGLSEDTMIVLDGDLGVIKAAVRGFKRSTLYAESEIHLEGSEPVPDDLQTIAPAFYREALAFERQQLFLGANDTFLFFISLPVDREGTWPDASTLKRVLAPVFRSLVCVLANKQGDEIQVVLPRSLSDSDKLDVLKYFMDRTVLETGWTEISPEDQHPADVTWPRLWYYENRPPRER